MTDVTPNSLLARSVEILDERGWHQGDYINKATGCVCARGAIRAAAAEAAGFTGIEFVDCIVMPRNALGESHPDLYTSMEEAEEAAREVTVGMTGQSVHQWNDDYGRTKEEVKDVLRRAAESEAAK